MTLVAARAGIQYDRECDETGQNCKDIFWESAGARELSVRLLAFHARGQLSPVQLLTGAPRLPCRPLWGVDNTQGRAGVRRGEAQVTTLLCSSRCTDTQTTHSSSHHHRQGQCQVREHGLSVHFARAQVLQKEKLPDHFFAEGLTRLGDYLYPLVWQRGTIFKWQIKQGTIHLVRTQ